jgi:trans-2-enoyl-CoA reductase
LALAETIQAAVARLETGKAFDAINDATENLSRRSSMVPAAPAEVSRIFQVSTEQGLAEGSDGSKEISRSN